MRAAPKWEKEEETNCKTVLRFRRLYNLFLIAVYEAFMVVSGKLPTSSFRVFPKDVSNSFLLKIIIKGEVKAKTILVKDRGGS
jgi:hypothetical protein